MTDAVSSCHLSLNDFRLWVSLGCTETEKKHPQCVSLSFGFDFKVVPGAVETDRLEDTICYGDIAKIAESVVSGRNFNTIEYLAGEIFTAVGETLARHGHPPSMLAVTVRKLSPPVPGLHGGATFTLSSPPRMRAVAK